MAGGLGSYSDWSTQGSLPMPLTVIEFSFVGCQALRSFPVEGSFASCFALNIFPYEGFVCLFFFFCTCELAYPVFQPILYGSWLRIQLDGYKIGLIEWLRRGFTVEGSELQQPCIRTWNPGPKP